MTGTALVTKLQTFADLSDSEITRLNHLCRNVRTVAKHQTIISQGDRPDHIHLISSGWAARYITMRDGSRQIVAFLVPGDFCDLHVSLLGEMDHTIETLTACHVCFIPGAEMDSLTSEESNLTKALWWGTLVDEAVLRSWVANVGRRDAHERIAHLLCEMHLRLKLVGLVSDGRLDLPVTQVDLADALGLTAVHTNRMLQRLRAEHLITFNRGILTLLDIDRLREVAGFDGRYLHVQRRRASSG